MMRTDDEPRVEGDPKPLSWDDVEFLAFVLAKEKEYEDRKARRECAHCGVDIKHRAPNAEYCEGCRRDICNQAVRDWHERQREAM